MIQKSPMSCITRSVTMSTLESFQILSERYLESWILCFRTFPDYNYVSSTVKRLYETSRFPKTSIQVLLHQECMQRTSIYLDCLGKYHPTRQISLCGVIPHDCTVHSRSLSIFLSANSRRCPRWMIFSAFLKPYLLHLGQVGPVFPHRGSILPRHGILLPNLRPCLRTRPHEFTNQSSRMRHHSPFRQNSLLHSSVVQRYTRITSFFPCM